MGDTTRNLSVVAADETTQPEAEPAPALPRPAPGLWSLSSPAWQLHGVERVIEASGAHESGVITLYRFNPDGDRVFMEIPCTLDDLRSITSSVVSPVDAKYVVTLSLAL